MAPSEEALVDCSGPYVCTIVVNDKRSRYLVAQEAVNVSERGREKTTSSTGVVAGRWRILHEKIVLCVSEKEKI